MSPDRTAVSPELSQGMISTKILENLKTENSFLMQKIRQLELNQRDVNYAMSQIADFNKPKQNQKRSPVLNKH